MPCRKCAEHVETIARIEAKVDALHEAIAAVLGLAGDIAPEPESEGARYLDGSRIE